MHFGGLKSVLIRKKRLVLGSLVFGAAVAVLTLTAVDSFRQARAATTNAAKSAALDEYGKHFEIQYYMGPSGQQIVANSSGIVSRIANSGFTIAPFRDSWDSQWTADSNSAAASALDSYNLKTYIFHGNNAEFGRQSTANAESFYNTYLKPYMDFKNVVGYDITDEPAKYSVSGVSVGLDITTPAVTNFYAVDPMRDSYVNLFPNYAPASCLEYKSATGCDGQGNLDLTAYETYLSSYLDNSAVRTLSVDYYPKAKDSLSSTYNSYSDRDLYYTNLRSILYHYVAKRNQNIQATPMNIVALHDWYVDNSSKSQVMYQVSNNLAFGMKRLSYFTYMQPPTGGGWSSGWLVGTDSITQSTFYSVVSDINSWAFNLGNELYSKEVDEIYQVAGVNKAIIYQDSNTVHNVHYLGSVSATSGGANAEAILTSFDDATFMIANGEPNKAIDFYFDGLSLSNMEYFDAYNNIWRSVSSGALYALASFNTSTNTVTLPAGSNVLLHMASGVSAKNTGVMIDKEGKRVVSYSSDLAGVTDNITSATKSRSGTTLMLTDGTYNILYPSSSAGCLVEPAFVFTGFDTSFSGCGFTTNSSLLSFTKLDDNYAALKYNSNGQQVKNLPIISASTSAYTVSGTTIKTNGATFDASKVTVTNGVGEQSGSAYNIYTWPLKIPVATYTIDTSAPVTDQAYFSNITVSSGSLTPSYTKTRTTYAATADSCSEQFTVTGVGNSSAGVATQTLTKSLTTGSVTPFTLTATDANNYTRSYTVNVSCTPDPVIEDHAYFTAVSLSAGNINFSPTTTSYAVSVDYNVESITISATGNATYGVANKSTTKNLTAGATTTITLTAVDENNFSRTYTFYVTRGNPPTDAAYFTNITLSYGTLSPSFSPSTTTYNVTVPYAVATMTVTGVGDSTAGVASQTLTKALVAGQTTPFVLTATDSNNFSRTYTVNVTRENPPVDHAYFTAVSVTPPPEDVFEFSPSVTEYSISYPYSVESVTIFATGNATYGVANKSTTKALTAGAVTNVVLTAMDENNYSRDYTFHITRASAPVDHAYFTNIELSAGTLSPTFSPETTVYNVRVANNVASLTVRGVGDINYGVSDKSLTKSLTAGTTTTFTLTATDENDFSRDYVVNVFREDAEVVPVDAAYFTNITVSDGTLSPSFAAETTEYNVTVPYSVASMTVRGVGNSAAGVADQSETKSLTAGATTVFSLTATDKNSFSRTYRVSVFRQAPSSSATLSSLAVSYLLDGETHNATLSPSFSPTVYSYNATVPNLAEEVSYSYMLGETTSSATGSILGTVTTSGTNVSVVVTAEDGTTSNTYNLTITREAPSEPDDPDEPSDPDDPDDPDNPDNPDDPDNPDEPSGPDDPDEPSEPGTPDQPENPDTPNDGGDSNNSSSNGSVPNTGVFTSGKDGGASTAILAFVLTAGAAGIFLTTKLRRKASKLHGEIIYK